ncbi:ankyrin repeat, SAM and basic leucine zipper domain-containing protein 1-like [Lingula anatina]|uniref:Ankyrin repeat, SAM and basic leucine zipper domain-containing protein 1-like n=1 Tax=Lingula anatina TaxID=7574 RepID=A0A1S3I9D3_LINAN|nr:ankyrin repeat, SAM and basic leucine zipper domain-containing protein 1-like [Lingula anatina]|eukprot:XP_013393994.1 ankyrin repeat, SAM and basic leucine zipper domain-containing protein 1-like [Lingula anatina]
MLITDDDHTLTTNGWCPLHLAALKGNADMVKLFLDSGAEVNAEDSGGWTPLHGAAYGGHKSIVKLLLERGADPNITDKDKLRPHDLAVKTKHECIMIMLQRFTSPLIQTHLLQKLIATISDQVSVRRIRFLGRRLGVPDSKLDNIRSQNPNNAQEESFQILREWMKRSAGATVHNLFKALKDHQLNACLDHVKNEYLTLSKEILAKSDDEFSTFCASLEYTDGITLSAMKKINMGCYVSDDMRYMDHVKNEYLTLSKEILAKSDDEFSTFCASLEYTDGLTLSAMKKINMRCYVSDDMRYMGLPLTRYNANSKERMALYRLEWNGNYEIPASYARRAVVS